MASETFRKDFSFFFHFKICACTSSYGKWVSSSGSVRKKCSLGAVLTSSSSSSSASASLAASAFRAADVGADAAVTADAVDAASDAAAVTTPTRWRTPPCSSTSTSFLPVAATDAARIAVREARQTEDETILAWHARLRSLFQRAHPALDAAGLEANVDLRDQFVLGMLDQDVISKVWHQRPGSYGEALTMANNVSAGNAIIQSRATERPPPAIKREPNINALGNSDGGSTISRAGPPGGCWDCGGNHYTRDCPKGGKGAGRGRGRGARAGIARRGRGRARGRGGRTRGSGRFTGRRRI